MQFGGLFSRWRFRFTRERELQDGIARALAAEGIRHRREVSLGEHGVIDFVIDGTDGGPIGLEVKVGGRLADVTRQLHRYARDPSLRALVLVTSLARLRRQPREMMGKALEVVHLVEGAL